MDLTGVDLALSINDIKKLADNRKLNLHVCTTCARIYAMHDIGYLTIQQHFCSCIPMYRAQCNSIFIFEMMRPYIVFYSLHRVILLI